MADETKQPGQVEEGLESLEKGVTQLRSDVTELRSDVTQLRSDVTELRSDLTELRGEVQKLRVLGEDNSREIKLIAEVQVQHGERLDEHGRMLAQIVRDIEPLKVLPEAFQHLARELAPLRDIRDFMQRFGDDHELRITALEKHTGIRD